MTPERPALIGQDSSAQTAFGSRQSTPFAAVLAFANAHLGWAGLPLAQAARGHGVCLVLVFVLALAANCPPATAGEIIHAEDFTNADARTGLPRGWSTGPVAHRPFFDTYRDTTVHGMESPSVRVDLPLRTLNYRVAAPNIFLPALNRDYTLSFKLRIEQPDSPFQVEVVYKAMDGTWIHGEPLLQLVGEDMSEPQEFTVSFNPSAGDAPGFCWITFGLSYSKVLRAGRFWLDDFEIRSGHEVEPLEFYAKPTSVTPGEAIDLHISAPGGQATVEVWSEEDRPRLVYGPAQLDGLTDPPTREEPWRNGCGWPVSHRISIPTHWKSGVYTVKVDDGFQRRWDTFVVRERVPETKLLVVLPSHTDQAYNGWGGASFYTSPPTAEVSFERPHNHGYWGFYHTPVHLIRWLHREGIPFVMADDFDLHRRGEWLKNYDAIVLTWHSEYWTGEMRSNIESFVAEGGSLISFSGNTCWWQTRLVDADDPVEPGTGERLVCYKYRFDQDPYHDIDPSRVTNWWDSEPVNRSGAEFLGTSWRHGGMVNGSTRSDCPCDYDWLLGYGGFCAHNEEHWIFEGTGVQNGAVFGQDYAIAGYEVDGAPLRKNPASPGTPIILDPSGNPSDFQLLGMSECWNAYNESAIGNALVAIRETERSFVFNGGTTGWCWGLADDPVVQSMTRNLIARAIVPDAPPLVLDLRAVPNPAYGHVTLHLGPTSDTEEGRSPLPVAIFDARGRRIGETWTRFEGGEAKAEWNFKDARGRTVPAGVYWAVGNEGRKIKVVRITR